MKRAGIGVSYDPASPFGYQIRILLQSMKDPLAKFVQRWDFIFKGDSRMLHIRCVDAKKSRGIFGRSGTDAVSYTHLSIWEDSQQEEDVCQRI